MVQPLQFLAMPKSPYFHVHVATSLALYRPNIKEKSGLATQDYVAMGFFKRHAQRCTAQCFWLRFKPPPCKRRYTTLCFTSYILAR